MQERVGNSEHLRLVHHNVLGTIREAIGDMGIDDELTFNIHAPVVEVERDGGRSQRLLEKVGIVGQFPLIIATEDPVDDARVSVFASERLENRDSQRETRVTELRFKAPQFFGQFKTYQLEVKRFGGLTYVSELTYFRYKENEEFEIGSSLGTKERAALLVEEEPHLFRLASVSLPKNWREAFPGGRLLDFPNADERPHEVMTALSPEALEIAGLIKEGHGSRALGRVMSYLTKFPKYSGPVLGKDKVRVADLGDERTPVEIEQHDDGTLSLTLTNLDTNALSDLCRGGRITAEGLVRCFTKKAEKSQHRLYMKIEAWGGDLMVDSHPLIWDIESRRLVESWKYLPYSAQSSEGLRDLFADPAGIIPKLISELKMPASLLWQSSGLAMGAGSVSRRNRGRNDRPEEKPSHRQERSSELWFSEYKTNQLLEGLSSSGSMNPTETGKRGSNDTPEAKKKYWANRAAKSKGSKVQAKNASKGKRKSKS